MRRAAQTLAAWAGCVALTAASADAQGVRLAPLDGQIGLRAEDTRQLGARQAVTAEWFWLTLSGWVHDPRLLSFQLGVSPTLTQNRLRTSAGDGQVNAVNLGADARVHLLRDRPFWLAGRYVRRGISTTESGTYEATRYTLAQTAGVEAHWDNPLMALALEYDREVWEERFAVATEAPTFAFESIRFSGLNRKTTLLLERRHSPNPDYTQRVGFLENRHTWGKGSQLRVTLNGNQQGGTSLPSSSNVDGRLTTHLQHTRILGTDWDLVLGRATAGEVVTRYWAGETGFTVRVAPWLSVGAKGNRSRSRSEIAERDAYRLGPRATSSLNLPGDVRLSLQGEMAYEHLTVAGPSGSFLPVVGEPHVVDEAGLFTLDNPDVDPASVVIRGPIGIYQAGLDYTLVDGQAYLEVLILPAGRLKPGTTVEVDYRYRARTSGAAPFLWATYAADLRVRRLRVYHRRWLQNPIGVDSLVGGAAVRYRSDSRFGAQFAFAGRRLSGSTVAEHARYADDALAIKSTSLTGNLSYRPLRRLTASTRLSYQIAMNDTVTTTVTSLGADLSWLPSARLTLAVGASGWRAVQAKVSQRTQLGGTARLAWRPGLLRVDVWYWYNNWRTELTDRPNDAFATPQHRLTLELSREF